MRGVFQPESQSTAENSSIRCLKTKIPPKAKLFWRAAGRGQNTPSAAMLKQPDRPFRLFMSMKKFCQIKNDRISVIPKLYFLSEIRSERNFPTSTCSFVTIIVVMLFQPQLWCYGKFLEVLCWQHTIEFLGSLLLLF